MCLVDDLGRGSGLPYCLRVRILGSRLRVQGFGLRQRMIGYMRFSYGFYKSVPGFRA